ncbi:CDP-glycerol glycerophosphotransferase family protein [Ruicaihuangia caeni]|uniref:CDP-glycerol glycerophosphotransferase family protein n=1 Tax=Ruicaihuangia caeni TaxID=3042517 RepID=UPI00338F9EE5
MSGFTFSAGNAAKLLSAPLYALGALATRLTPRNARLWVFGCGSGLGEGALELARHVARADPKARVVWLGRDEAEVEAARARGLQAARRASWRGLRATLRAGVIVITHGFGDVNRFAVRGAFIVQLWHGIPLKRIQLDASATFDSPLPLEGLLRRLYRLAGRNITLMPAAGNISAERLRSAFGLPAERVVVTGDPRDDVLCRGTATEREFAARALLAPLLTSQTAGATGTAQHERGVRLVLHAPTWRDGEPDPVLPTDSEWAAIDAWLERTGSVLLLRPHPHSVGAYAEAATRSPRVALVDSEAISDVNTVLAAVDVLITDYSSIAFDFALTGRPILFLAPDLERYSQTRGLYEEYHDFSGGMEASDWAALLDLLERFDRDPATRRLLRDHSERLATRHHAYRDGRNTDRVYDAIVQRLPERSGGRA